MAYKGNDKQLRNINESLSVDEATTETLGIVELAENNENAPKVVVQGNDDRLSNERIPVDNSATNVKLADMDPQTIKGRIIGSTGDPQDLTASQVRSIINVEDGANNYVHPNHSGDVVSAGDGATTIQPNVVDNSKADDMAVNTIKGRITAGTGDPEDLTATQVRTIINVQDGANNYTHPDHTGDVASVGDGATTINNDVVNNAKLTNMAEDTIKGRITTGTGDPEDLTASQVRTIINVADGANNYVHPDHSGDIVSVGDGATTIQDDVVTNAKAANMPANTVKLNNTNAASDPNDLSMPASTILARLSTGDIIAANPTQVKDLLDIEEGPLPIIVLSSTDTSTTISQSTAQILSWDVETEKDSAFTHDNSTNNSRITIVDDGTYKIQANIRVESSGQRLQLVSKILINGVVQSQPFGSAYIRNAGNASDFWTCVVNPPPIKLSAGDYVEIQTQVESQTTTAITGTFQGTDSSFSVTYLKALKGDKGDAGAGSNIIVQEDDSTIGTVTDTLNFEGNVSLTDEGSNKTTVNVDASKIVFSDYIIGVTSDPSTTATSSGAAPVISEMTKTFTPASASNKIEVYFSGTFTNTNFASDENARIAIFIDGTIEPETERRTFVYPGDEYFGNLTTFWQGSLSASSHTITIRMWGSGGTTEAEGVLRNLLIREIQE